MKKFLKLLLVFLFVFILTQKCFAEDVGKVLVLPDNLQFESTNYLIYPDASVIFASDVINSFKKSGKVQTVSMKEVRDKFRGNLKTQLLAKNILKEYKYNYNVSFVDLKTLANTFNINKILLITSSTDVQNYFMRRTLWDFLNIPGATVIDPAYKISTYVALVDVDKEEVLWQQTYHKTLNSWENRIVAVNFAPATEQLEKIKFYSENILAPMVVLNVESKLLPTASVNATIVSPNAQTGAIPEFLNQPLPETNIQFKTKPIVPKRESVDDGGAMINEL